MDTPIMLAYGPTGRLEVWFANSAATIHVSPKCKYFSSYQKYDKQCDIKAFGNNTDKGAGEGDIDADIDCRGKTTRIQITQVMHVPEAKGQIHSLKVLPQNVFHILADHICITKKKKDLC